VESGDLLGYTSRGKVYSRVDHLMVYPKLFELEVGALAARRLVGRQATDRVILTDPSRTVGVRAFRPGDPLRYVEWRTTARRNELLVRTFEPTTDLSLAIFLDFQPAADDAVLEFAISVAASVARWGLRRGYPVGMFGNGGRGETDVMRVPVSASPNQLVRILDALARAEPLARMPLGPRLVAEAARLSYETSVVLVTAGLDEVLLAALAEARRQHPVTLVHVQAPGAPVVRALGLPVIGVPYEAEWERRERLRLAA
jgi:uncharacterized protein (DUF58 family)